MLDYFARFLSIADERPNRAICNQPRRLGDVCLFRRRNLFRRNRLPQIYKFLLRLTLNDNNQSFHG